MTMMMMMVVVSGLLWSRPRGRRQQSLERVADGSVLPRVEGALLLIGRLGAAAYLKAEDIPMFAMPAFAIVPVRSMAATSVNVNGVSL